MGLFSRRGRTPKPVGGDPVPAQSLNSSKSKTSLNSGSSSIKSPGFSSNRIMNRTSAGTTSTAGGPGTPPTPFSPIPKIDMPKPPDPQLDPVGYLRSLGAVRARSKIVTDKALRNELNHFDVDMSKFGDVVSFVANIIKAGYLSNAPFYTLPGPQSCALSMVWYLCNRQDLPGKCNATQGEHSTCEASTNLLQRNRETMMRLSLPSPRMVVTSTLPLADGIELHIFFRPSRPTSTIPRNADV